VHQLAPRMPLIIQENFTARLAEALKEGHLAFERVAPTVGLLFGDKAEQALLAQRERLQEDGIYID